MTTGTPRSGRIPRDTQTRDRLREAQLREAGAVAAVCAANESLVKARAKRAAVLASATTKVDQAQSAVAKAQAALVAVSGVDRAALLLDVEPAELRKVKVPRNGRRLDA